MNTFYMVFVEGCATLACKHESLDSAEKEAKRLATLLKKKAYVLCTIKSVEDTQYKIEDCRPSGSDLPFLIGTVMKQTVEEAAISSHAKWAVKIALIMHRHMMDIIVAKMLNVLLY